VRWVTQQANYFQCTDPDILVDFSHYPFP
jgi:hypothetical protein